MIGGLEKPVRPLADLVSCAVVEELIELVRVGNDPAQVDGQAPEESAFRGSRGCVGERPAPDLVQQTVDLGRGLLRFRRLGRRLGNGSGEQPEKNDQNSGKFGF